jgi:renalase
MPPTRRPRAKTSSAPASRSARAVMAPPNRVAVVGAGMAGVACARTLAQAGHRVSVFDKSLGAGGRMATRETEFGGFDHGAQYFTVRDPRFQLALQATAAQVQPWQANTVRVLDPLGQTLASATASETHWVPVPGMNALVRSWAAPLADGSLGAELLFDAKVVRIERDALHPTQWQLRTEGRDGSQHVHGGFDRIVLAMPHPQAAALLQASALAPQIRQALAAVSVRPCWTLMIAFPQAMQPGLTAFGPRWHAARSSSHRVCWLARESSKPGRGPVERWTVQASPVWSAEHHEDDPERVKAKLLKGFAEITGIRATPSQATVHRWSYAQTQTPLGRPFEWDARLGIGLCGDWCLGHRVEDAFVSGLELALAMA